MIIIVDIGLGNLGSILNMLKKVKVEARISSRPEDIEGASKLILPGVGAFDNANNNLDAMGLRGILQKRVMVDRVPILGICLGMQLFSKRSEEGASSGLAWIDAETIRFRFVKEQNGLKVPHMGWNTVNLKHNPILFEGLEKDARFYFVHSYHLICTDESNVMTTTSYGHDFASSISRDNIYGTQFHPEKSHRFGMRLLKNFAERT
jgi:glutamine amidotransferase